jgi:hypothetical protein
MSGLHTIEAMGNQLSGSIPNEMVGMNPNLRLNFTDNLYVIWHFHGQVSLRRTTMRFN